MKKFIRLFISLGIPLFTGFLGSVFTSMSVTTWYKTLNKPAFNPPDSIFAPVWTLLFILMGISFYLVWNNNTANNKKPFVLFFIQLFLNHMWSVFFFALRNPLLAFIDITVLIAFIIITIVTFYRISKTAVYLFMPYLIWVSFAAVLNFSILILN